MARRRLTNAGVAESIGSLRRVVAVDRVDSIIEDTVVIDACDHTLGQAFKKSVIIDADRFRAGGVTASVFTPCVPAASTEGSVPEADEHPFHTLLQMYDYLLEQTAGGDGFVLATSAGDIERAREDGRIAVVLGMEGGDPFNDPYCDVAVLRTLYRMGLRHVQLVHDGRNALGTSTRFYEGADAEMGPGRTADHLGRIRHDYDPDIDGPGGLTQAGKEFVREMDRLGIIIDVSHMVEAGFWEVLDASEGPVIVSHSNVRARVDCQRNLTDEQIAALARRGGVVGVCGKPLCPSDLRTRDLEDIVDDIEYIADLVGPEHVGIGTDEGSGNIGLGDYSPRPLKDIVPPMLERGHGKEFIQSVLGHNFLRVFKEVLK